MICYPCYELTKLVITFEINEIFRIQKTIKNANISLSHSADPMKYFLVVTLGNVEDEQNVLPVHAVPEPIYPSEQVHVNDPTVLMQLALK